jgi:antirestriction protein ArdC
MKSNIAKAQHEPESKFNVQKALEHIEDGLKNIQNNQEWIKFLAFQSRFHDYSFNNTLLIYLQDPNASFVCGYSTWRNMDRYVIKGQKAIKILAPCRYKVEQEDDETSDMYVVKGFRVVSVFDLRQTDGDTSSIPIVIHGMKDDSNDLTALYDSLINSMLEIEVKEVSNIRPKGYYDPVNQLIAINSSLATKQKIKTLIHEYTHHLHLTRYFNDESRDLAEVIAESSAYIVSSYLGIDTSDYSIPYINSWTKDTNGLKLIGNKIQQISHEIINSIIKPLENANACSQEAFCINQTA